jgi:hypothetical protein
VIGRSCARVTSAVPIELIGVNRLWLGWDGMAMGLRRRNVSSEADNRVVLLSDQGCNRDTGYAPGSTVVWWEGLRKEGFVADETMIEITILNYISQHVSSSRFDHPLENVLHEYSQHRARVHPYRDTSRPWSQKSQNRSQRLPS